MELVEVASGDSAMIWTLVDCRTTSVGVIRMLRARSVVVRPSMRSSSRRAALRPIS